MIIILQFTWAPRKILKFFLSAPSKSALSELAPKENVDKFFKHRRRFFEWWLYIQVDAQNKQIRGVCYQLPSSISLKFYSRLFRSS